MDGNRPADTYLKVGSIFEIERSNLVLSQSDVSNLKKFASKATQTDYRESEAQTDPWDPPFKVSKVHKEPEVLSFTNFSFGKGLPACKLEMNYILETRKNRDSKDSLRAIESDELLMRKKQITRDQLRSDWNYRIAVLNEKQLNKLTAMQSDLADEIGKYSNKKGKVLRNMWKQKRKEMNNQNSKLQEKLQKELRSVKSHYLDVKHDGIIRTDSTFKKGFKTEIKKLPFSKGTEYMLSDYYLTNTTGLIGVKNWLETKADGLKTEIPLSRVFKRTQREKIAEKAYQCILDQRRSKLPPKTYREDYEKEETQAPSVKAEDVNEFVDFVEKKIDLVTVWQKALRGLAQQKQMLELIENHKEGLSTILAPLYPELANS
ncbi:hypothetical protein NPIL_288341 [Nephila pilipes]|uniref:Cilia- and flagella-associated protein 91 n=1 Tax=Nephila pilipes TaxID=299642 RepID=A0A8X6QJA5_NEPPI|nr:hypothetical protein NPIL_288341 [Nephila pilipes]